MSTEEILKRLQWGDDPTWKAFVQELHPALHHRLLQALDNDEEKAEDVAAEIWLLIAQAIKRLSNPGITY